MFWPICWPSCWRPFCWSDTGCWARPFWWRDTVCGRGASLSAAMPALTPMGTGMMGAATGTTPGGEACGTRAAMPGGPVSLAGGAIMAPCGTVITPVVGNGALARIAPSGRWSSGPVMIPGGAGAVTGPRRGGASVVWSREAHRRRSSFCFTSMRMASMEFVLIAGGGCTST